MATPPSALRVPHSEQLSMFAAPPPVANVEWLIGMLNGADWTLAADLVPAAGKSDTENNRRWVRHLADASGGRVIGGQRGYKLTSVCTLEEYDHWRNASLSMAREIQRRVIEADKIHYYRQAAPSL